VRELGKERGSRGGKRWVFWVRCRKEGKERGRRVGRRPG